MTTETSESILATSDYSNDPETGTPTKKLKREKTRAKKFVWEFRASAKEYREQTSASERERLREVLNSAITYFLESARPVYLDKVGFFLPLECEVSNSHLMNGNLVIKNEKSLTPIFEKASEITSFHKSQYPNTAELSELAQYIYARLSLEEQLKWSEKRLRWLLRGLLLSIRNEVVIDGFSNQLQQVGDLFALHNRQGENATDWFAGANILLHPNLRIPVSAELATSYQQPILNSPWELLEAGFGEALTSFKIDVEKELKTLEFALPEELLSQGTEIAVSAFLTSDNKGSQTLIFCSDGIRTKSSTKEEGTELLIQMALEESSNTTEQELVETVSSSALPRRLFSLAYLMLLTREEKTIRPGLGLSADQPLLETSGCELSGIFITPCRRIPLPQNCEDQRFHYLNVIAVTEDELQFSEKRSSEHLLSVLQCKRIDQINSATRRSVFARSNTGKKRSGKA